MKINLVNDSHVHLSFDTSLPGTEKAWRLWQERCGVERINFLALNAHEGFEIPELHDARCLYLKARFGEMGYAGFCLDYHRPETRDEILIDLKDACAGGFDCWKIIEGKPDVQNGLKHSIDSDFYEPCFAFAEAAEFPIVCHVADPIQMWGKGGKYEKGFLPKEEYQNAALRILRRHPNLRWTFAHFGFFSDRPVFVEKLLETYPYLMFDNVPAPEEYFVQSAHAAEWHAIFESHPERFLFGTDRGPHPVGLLSSNEYFVRFPETVSYQKRIYLGKGIIDGRYPFPGYEDRWGTEWQALDLNDEAYNDLVFYNFLRRYGLKPREVNPQYLLNLANHDYSLPSSSKTKREDYALIRAYCEERGASSDFVPAFPEKKKGGR